MKNIKIIPLILSLLACYAAGAIGSYFSIDAIPTWYTTLNRPPFNPPNWIFGPVWSTLYAMMGVSLYLIWQKKTNSLVKKQGIWFFAIQLILNTLWTIVFFALQSPTGAFLMVIALLVFIVLTIRKFSKISKPAAYLLYPYLAWVSFASILNFSIMILNW